MDEEKLIVFTKRRRRYSSCAGEISSAIGNVVDRDFHADAVNTKWLTDVTEFQHPAGKVYLSPMIDCFDGMVVSQTIGTSADAELVNTMLAVAVAALMDIENGLSWVNLFHVEEGVHAE